MKFIKHSCVVLVLALTFTSVAFAGSEAIVSGTVYGPDGITVLPNITVELLNRATNFKRTVVTGSDGGYSIPNVPPATNYEISAIRNGAVIAKNTGIQVEVGDDAVIFPALQEQVATQQTLAAASDKPKQTLPNRVIQNDLRSSAISATVSSTQLRSLPLFNRTFLALGLLAPNTHDVEGGSPLTGATFSMAGAPPSSNNFLLDGMDNVASSINQAIPFQVNDAIQEFRVVTSTAPAEFGRGQGGVVNIVTRRGENDIHGSAFGYFANDKFNANTPLSVYSNTTFAKAAAYAGQLNSPAAPLAGTNVTLQAPDSFNQLRSTACKPGSTALICANDFNPASILQKFDSHSQPYSSQQFGFNMGGAPVRDKLFLFSSYEGTRIENPNPIFERVPTAFDHTAANAALAASPDFKLAQKVLALYPTPNVVAVPGVLEFFRGQAPNFTHVNNLLFRTDLIQSEKTSYTLRYSGQLLDQIHDDSLPSGGQYPGNGADRKAQNQSVTLVQTHTFGNGWINEARLGFTQFRVAEIAQDSSFDATALGLKTRALPSFLLAGLDPRAGNAAPGTVGLFGGWFDSFWAASQPTKITPSLDGLFPFARIGAPLTAPSSRRDSTSVGADTLSITSAKHAFKFGVEHRYIQNLFSDGGISRGYVVANNIGEFTNDAETCISCDTAFQRPSFDYAILQPNRYAGDFRSYAASAFAQDTWKLRPTLTLNYGIRYEYFSVPKEQSNQIWNFDPTANGLVRQGSSLVVDAFSTPCQVGTPHLDSVVRSKSLVTPWSCALEGSGKAYNVNTTNFAPRLGFAWSPRNGNTVIRGSAGLFYDQLPTSYIAQLLKNRPTPLNFNDPSAIIGQNFLTTGCPGGSPASQCGLGNTSLNPSTLTPAQLANFQFNQAASGAPAIYGIDVKHSKTPYAMQVSGSLQQQLGRNFAGEIGYVGAFGYNQPVIYNAEFQNEWFCITSSNSGGQSRCDTFSYFPIFTSTNRGGSDYNSMMFRLRAAQFHGLRFNAMYTLSRARDNASSGTFPEVSTTLFNQLFGAQFYGLANAFGFALGSNVGSNFSILGRSVSDFPRTSVRLGTTDVLASALTTTGARQVILSRYGLPQDPTNFLHDDYGRSDFDVHHRFVLDYSYDLPVFKNSNLLGNWQLSGILVAQSGQPYTIFAGPAFGEVTQRGILNGNVTTANDPSQAITGSLALPGASARCLSVYAQPVLFNGQVGAPCTGNTARNQFTGPNLINMDMAIQKSFNVFDDVKKLHFRAEFYNLFDRSNFYNPISALSLDGFKFNPDFGKIKSAHDPREIQLAVRFDF